MAAPRSNLKACSQRIGLVWSMGLIGSAVNACDDAQLFDASGRLRVEPLNLDFGQIPTGGQEERLFAVVNDGQSPLPIGQMSLDANRGEFAFAPTIETVLPAEEIQVRVVFAPRELGSRENGVTIVAGDDGDQIRRVALRGQGIEGDLRVDADEPGCSGQPSSVSFGAIALGENAMRTFIVEAIGTDAIRLQDVSFEAGTSSEFTLAPFTALRLEPGEQATLTVNYAPVDAGSDEGIVLIETDSSAVPTVRVSICGIGAGAALCARPAALDFGALIVPETQTRPVTLEACGTLDVTVETIEVAQTADRMSDSGYRVVDPPASPVRLQPGQTIELDVQLAVNGLGQKNGWLDITTDALGMEVVTVPLIGRGAQPCELSVLPNRLVFVDVATGESEDRSVLLTNSGARQCEITRIDVLSPGSAFGLGPLTGPVSVPSGGSVELSVTYAPTTAGPHAGTLEIEDAGGVEKVELVGAVEPPNTCTADARPPFINFGAVPPRDGRVEQTEIVNISFESCTFQAVELSEDSDLDFRAGERPFAPLNPGESVALTVTYAPSEPGTARGTLLVDVSSLVGVDVSRLEIPVVATSAPISICVSPQHVAFGERNTPGTLPLTIAACGGAAVVVHGIEWTMPDAELAILSPPPFPLVLAPGSTQAITLQYTPADGEGDTAELSIRSDDPARPAIAVPVSGGPEITPSAAGRWLYFWQIPAGDGGDIMRLPLQGIPTVTPFWGPRTGQSCSGCHSASPDGRYLALIESATFQIIDTETRISLPLPNAFAQPNFLSWRPDVATNPPYQYAYGDGEDITIASVFAGDLRVLAGADQAGINETMPSWGPNGRIAFVRGTRDLSPSAGEFGLRGPTDILLVDEDGGVPVPLTGASGDSAAHYYPSFSPSGRWIAITHSASGSTTVSAPDGQIRLIRGDNSGTVLPLGMLNGMGGAASYPTWSRDGAFVSFASDRPGGAGDWDLYVAPIDQETGQDGPAQNLSIANTANFEHAGQWSP